MSATNKPPPSDPALAGESNVPRILGLGITFHALALVAVAMRMYTRVFIVKSFGRDDVMMALCIVSHTCGRHPVPPVATETAEHSPGSYETNQQLYGRRSVSLEEEWLRY